MEVVQRRQLMTEGPVTVVAGEETMVQMLGMLLEALVGRGCLVFDACIK